MAGSFGQGYRFKATYTTATPLSATFTPNTECDTWQVRIDWTSGAGGSMAIITVDEDGGEVTVLTKTHAAGDSSDIMEFYGPVSYTHLTLPTPPYV